MFHDMNGTTNHKTYENKTVEVYVSFPQSNACANEVTSGDIITIELHQGLSPENRTIRQSSYNFFPLRNKVQAQKCAQIKPAMHKKPNSIHYARRVAETEAPGCASNEFARQAPP